MRYTIEDENGDSVSVESDPNTNPGARDQGVILTVGDGGQFIFTHAEFKEFRKAIGYVWQEVHPDGE